MMGFHPYLYFDGTCGEAFALYHELFGGELQTMTGHDAPPVADIPDDKRNLTMHASLLTADGSLLMGSDSYDDDFTPPNSLFVHYATTDLDHAKTVFETLSEGAQVHMPAQAEFWTPYFGVLTDRFGTPWQVSVESGDPDQG